MTCIVDCYPLPFHDLRWLALGFALAMIMKQWRFVPVAAAAATLLLLAIETLLLTIERALLSRDLNEEPFANLQFLWTSQIWWASVALNFASLLVAISFFFALKRALVWAVTSKGQLVLRGAVILAVCAVILTVAFAALFTIEPTLLPRRIVERTMDVIGTSPARCKPGDAGPVAGLPSFRGIDRRKRTSAPRLTNEQAAWPAVYTTQTGGFEHLLTRRAAIRVQNPGRYGPHKAVALRLAIDERGDVVAVTATGGPPQLHAHAIAIASQWKFVPFIRDGKPIPVRLERETVRIEGPEQWSATPSRFPAFSDWDSVVVQLSIFDHEHGLALEIRGDGSVTFDGRGSLVALPGRHCAVISQTSLRALIDAIRQADLFAMRDHYESSDLTVAVRVGLDDHGKEVRSSGRDREEAPDRLYQLVGGILESVHAERWISGDRFTVPSLVAERWDFARNDEANTRILAGVADRGDPDTVRKLVAGGAQVVLKPSIDRSGFPGSWRDPRTAIERAAEHGQFDTVEVLLSAPINWSTEALTGAYIAALEFGNTELASRLVARGASQTGSNTNNRTALMAAARSGLPELVARALAMKPDVDAQDTASFTALHWAAGVDYLRAIDSMRANRRKAIDLLIAAGAEVDARGHARWTPLLSNWMGLAEVTDALIAHGADANAQDEDGVTPLMTNKSVGAVRRLLEAGANPYLRRRDGKNALDVARGDVHSFDIAGEIERWMATHPEQSLRR